MLVLPTVVTRASLIQSGRRGTDLVALVVMTTGMLTLAWLFQQELRAWARDPDTLATASSRPATAAVI